MFEKTNTYYSLKRNSTSLNFDTLCSEEQEGEETYLLALSPGWTNFEEKIFGKAQIDKVGHLCLLQGAISTSQHRGDQPAHCATLPIHCRPSTPQCFFLINIHPTGEIYCLPQTGSDMISLCGITFVSQ
jgi:hypothetical protein